MNGFGTSGRSYSCYSVPGSPPLVIQERLSEYSWIVLIAVPVLIFVIGVRLICCTVRKVRKSWESLYYCEEYKAIDARYVDNRCWTVISVLGLTSYIYVFSRLHSKSKQRHGTDNACCNSNGQPSSGVMRNKKVGKAKVKRRRRRKRLSWIRFVNYERWDHGRNFVAESGGYDSQIFSQARQKLLYRAVFCLMPPQAYCNTVTLISRLPL